MKKTLTKTTKSSVLCGDAVKISVQKSAKVVAAYQSVSYQAAVEATVPLTSKKKGFEELWQLCTNQLVEQLKTAETDLQALIEIQDEIRYMS